MRAWLAALALGVLALPVAAQDKRVQSTTHYAQALFEQACVHTVGEPAKVSAFADSFLMSLDDGEARAYLGSHAGRAWEGVSGGGRFALTLRDDGMCTVHAPQVDVVTLRAAFQALLPVAQPDRAVETLPLSVSTQPQGEVEHSAYVVSALAGAQHARELYTAVISTSRSAQAPMQAVMTLWPR